MTVDPFDPPLIFYELMAKDCRCCPACGSVPCDGVCAGGVCDDYCRCDYDDFDSVTDRERCDCGNDVEYGEQYCTSCQEDTLGEP